MKATRYIIAALALLGLSACSLDHEDYTQISPDNFPKTDNDLKLAVNALYYDFNPGGWDGVYAADRTGYQVLSDMTTDDAWCSWGWEWDTFYYQQWYATVGGAASASIYKAFSRYNYLSKARNTIRRIEESPASDEAKHLYKAEAEALRGWMGLYLYDFFGPVPVADDATLDDAQTLKTLPRLTDAEYDQMMETDLTDAIQYLPEKPEKLGRMTKGAARMILMKYWMIRGDFKKAEQLARDLYGKEGTTYGLMSNYQDIFSIDHEGNEEIILCLPCNSDVSWYSNYMTAECLPVDYPWTDKSTGWGGYIMPWDFYDTFEQGDGRLKSLAASYVNKSGKVISREEPNGGQLAKGAIVVKYGVDPNMNDARSGVDLVVYRFSDVLLSLAECITRNQNQVTAEAVQLVNRVRQRAGLADLSADATATPAAFLDAILLERGHEFFFEGLRRQDLIRFGRYASTANDRIAKANANGSSYFTVTDNHNRFWIPQEYIDESKGQIKQNEGY